MPSAATMMDLSTLTAPEMGDPSDIAPGVFDLRGDWPPNGHCHRGMRCARVGKYL
jgi:hypothetical protein